MKLLLGLVLLSVAVPALADEAAPPKQERKICRREQNNTDTRMAAGTRVCLTAAEWRARDESATDDSDAMGSRAKAYNDIKRSLSTGAAPH
jgi:hypothetical protein